MVTAVVTVAKAVNNYVNPPPSATSGRSGSAGGFTYSGKAQLAGASGPVFPNGPTQQGIIDFTKLKPDPAIGASPTGPPDSISSYVNASGCIILGCLEAGVTNDKNGTHLVLGLSIAIAVGFSLTIGASSVLANKGWGAQANCSASVFNVGVDTGGNVSGGVNIIPAEAGCSAGATYTF